MSKIKISHNYTLKYVFAKEHKERLYYATLYRYNTEVGSYILSVDSDRCGFLSSFLIEEQFVGEGNGKVLSKSLVKLCQELNVETVFFYANPYQHKRLDSQKLIDFYTKHLHANIIDNSDLGPYMCFEIYS